MNGTLFGLWRLGDRSTLEAMSMRLTHCGGAQQLYDLGASVYVGVRSPDTPPTRQRVAVVYVGTISNVPATEVNTEEDWIWRFYCQAGADGFRHLRGAYQVALYDRERRRLILAVGNDANLPLCVERCQQGWAFASELKALPMWPSEIGKGALTALHVWPGQVGTFDEEGAHASIAAFEDASAEHRAPESVDAVAELRRAIIATTRRVTEGCYAPGVAFGPDIGSLLCLGAVRWILRDRPVRTYSVVYGERDPFRAYAECVARHYETDHQEIILTAATARTLLGELAWECEEPCVSERMLDHLLIARQAAGEVDLLMNGDVGFNAAHPSSVALCERASFERVLARAGVPGTSLFHDAEVRALCVRGAHRLPAKNICALGAGFVPARLFEEARRCSRRANDRFQREMAQVCAELLGSDSLTLRGVPAVGRFDKGSQVSGGYRCLRASDWSRAMLETWCRVFLDGAAGAPRAPALSEVFSPGRTPEIGSVA